MSWRWPWEKTPARLPIDAATALWIRRAGLEHLITSPTAEEVKALADAGSTLDMERAALLVKAFQNPSGILAPFDGGAARRAEVKAAAYALSRLN